MEVTRTVCGGRVVGGDWIRVVRAPALLWQRHAVALSLLGVVVATLAALVLLAASAPLAARRSRAARLAVPRPLFLLLLFCFSGSVGIHFGASRERQKTQHG